MGIDAQTPVELILHDVYMRIKVVKASVSRCRRQGTARDVVSFVNAAVSGDLKIFDDSSP